MKLLKLFILSFVLVITGCGTTQNQFLYGSALGSLGGFLGAQFGNGSGQIVSASAGALAGYVLGDTLGRTVDDVEKIKENSININ